MGWGPTEAPGQLAKALLSDLSDGNPSVHLALIR